MTGDPPGVPARRAALRLLDAVLRRGLALDAATGPATGSLARDDDRALARAIAGEVLRRLPDLDALIDGATPRRLPGDAKARFALRIALVQTLVLHTPPHAAIATVLPLVEGGPRRVVHGVFGSLMRRGATLPGVPRLPAAVEQRWRGTWGKQVLADAARAIATPPPLDVTLADPAATEALAAELDGVGLMPGHLRLARGGDVAHLPGYAAGAWWVQDLAASLPARLLGAGGGRGALDLCAAPGGKTMQLAAAGWRVTALDLSPARLDRLAANLARTKLAAAIVVGDLATWSPAEPVDAILLDAPCSATGIFRRHPDVLHRVRAQDIAHLAAQQIAFATRAAAWLKPGGTMVYATCSAEPEEGEAVLDALLAACPTLAIDPIAAHELPAGLAPDDRGALRIRPGALADAGGCDAFFVARLARPESTG